MLTIDYDIWQLHPGELVLDLGCGGGRHSFEALKRGADVVALDLSLRDLSEVASTCEVVKEEGEAPSHALAACAAADALALPFRDAVFDGVIASEVLEHLHDDAGAMSEIARVTKPGGKVAVSVPRWWPERICWALSRDYRTADGGHVRVYRAEELTSKLADAGLVVSARHHAHALHSPYWWLKCAFGLSREEARLPTLYHRFLVWEITRRPWATRLLERLLDPLLGKSFVAYAEKRDGTSLVA